MTTHAWQAIVTEPTIASDALETALLREIESEVRILAESRLQTTGRLIVPSDVVAHIAQPTVSRGIAYRARQSETEHGVDYEPWLRHVSARVGSTVPLIITRLSQERGWRAYLCEAILRWLEPTQEEIEDVLETEVLHDEDEGWRAYAVYRGAGGWVAVSAWDLLAHYGLDPDGDPLDPDDPWVDARYDALPPARRMRAVWTLLPSLIDGSQVAEVTVQAYSPVTEAWSTVPGMPGVPRDTRRLYSADEYLSAQSRERVLTYVLQDLHLHRADITDLSVLSWDLPR